MQLGLSSAQLPPMSTERGAAIQRRLDDLGISDREFHETTGIDRKTLRRAVAGEERVRPSTYAAIESALDRLEDKVAARGVAPVDSRLIEFDVYTSGQHHVVVKGPIEDAELLRAQVTAILRDMEAREGRDVANGGDDSGT